MINILIADDSRTESKLLKFLFEAEKDMQVVGIARDGREVVEMAATLHPDIITMDLEMPIMDGHTATRLIMSQHPVPIVVISAKLNDASRDMTFLALEAGAVSVMAKPVDVGSKGFERSRKQIVDTVRSMSEIKVIKRRFKPHQKPLKKSILSLNKIKHHPPGSFELIAIGTSIGGPQALKTILSQLPADFPIPIVIVQHMSKGFMKGFTQWLNNNISLTVKNIEHNEPLRKGFVYFAPDDLHLKVLRKEDRLVGSLTSGEPVSGFRPSITVLMQSIAKTCGKNAVGMLLTGMGNDGAEGLLDLKHAKGHTLIQDEKSCVVFGMAGVAESLGAVDKTLEIDQIADYFITITSQKLKDVPK